MTRGRTGGSDAQSAAPAVVTAHTVAHGQWYHPAKLIQLFSAGEWEEFIEEWVASLEGDYAQVERHGGAGDQGRDVVGYVNDDGSVWDNYQCKHYGNRLTPTDVWSELGKLLHYTFIGDYTYPRRYYFVAPQGAGTTLSNYLRRPEQLRSELLDKWDRYCKDHITSTAAVELTAELRAHIERADFSIFKAPTPREIIEQHAKTKDHIPRFGGGLPARDAAPAPPPSVAAEEAVYVRHLLDAYADHLGRDVVDVDALTPEVELNDHLHESRVDFYSAEALRTFTRDTLPDERPFEDLQEEIRVGIMDQVRRRHPNGYERVLCATSAARSLPITSNALVTQVTARDRGGICHQLANADKVRWVR